MSYERAPSKGHHEIQRDLFSSLENMEELKAKAEHAGKSDIIMEDAEEDVYHAHSTASWTARI